MEADMTMKDAKAEVRIRVATELAGSIERIAELAAVPADHVVGVILALYLLPMTRTKYPDAEEEPVP